MSDSRAILCPYCGDRQVPSTQCRACGGLFDVWSLHATQNEMGAWFVRDPRRPHFVGFGYEALCAAIRNGEIGRDAIVRGPSTRQLWTLARRVPGLAHLFGRCYACQDPMAPDEPACRGCGAAASVESDRNFFGLPAFEPIAPPANAKPDLNAFVLDAGLLVVRAVPVRSPARTVVRVAQPVERMAVTSEFVPDFVRNASGRPPATGDATSIHPAVANAANVSSHATTGVPNAAPALDTTARSALSPIDRGLLERSRRLESRNTLLLGTTAAGLAFALLFGFAYFIEKDDRAKAIESARREGAESVRSEFKRSTPVVVPPPAELPAMPNDPGTNAGKPSGASSSGTSSPSNPSGSPNGNPSGRGGSDNAGGRAPAGASQTAPAIPPAPAFGSQASPRRGV